MATYKIRGTRFVRMYRAENDTPVYGAAMDAARIAEQLCDVPWKESAVPGGGFPAHAGNDKTDQMNVQSREAYDAYELCAGHENGVHRAYAGAACYRFELPDEAVGTRLASLACAVSSDPYNRFGLRISVNTNGTGIIPTVCAVCRNGASDDVSPEAQTNNATEDDAPTEWTSTNTHVEGAAPRLTVTADGTNTWYGNSGTARVAPEGGLTLQKFLYVFVILENYNYARNGYLEGSGYASPLMTMETETAVEGWTDGATYDLSMGHREYALVRGGVAPRLPEGAHAVRTATVMRTGDDMPAPAAGEEGPELPEAEMLAAGAAASAEQGVMGLRALYARLYAGALAPKEMEGAMRPGAAFTVRTMRRKMATADGGMVEMPVWQMCVSALVLPFAAPTSFAARRIRIAWQAAGTFGSRLNVWLARGEMHGYDEKVLGNPALYDAKEATADAYVLVGTVDASSAGSAEFDIQALTDRTATLIVTAFVDMDAVNPSAEEEAAYGIGALEDDWIAGEIVGMETAVTPDITLIG